MQRTIGGWITLIIPVAVLSGDLGYSDSTNAGKTHLSGLLKLFLQVRDYASPINVSVVSLK